MLLLISDDWQKARQKARDAETLSDVHTTTCEENENDIEAKKKRKLT